MRLGLLGTGRLGQAVLAAAEGADDVELVWAADSSAVLTDLPPVDVALDVSIAAAVPAHVRWAVETGTPLVIGATGWLAEGSDAGEALSREGLEALVGEATGVLLAPNFSLTVALLRRLARVIGAWAALDEARDPWLLDHHHSGKADAPSGTAVALADAVLSTLPRKERWVVGGAPGVLAPTELVVGVVRAGSQAGRHTLGLDSPAETLEITHEARSREPFARGALEACRWLPGRRGVLDIDDLADDLLAPVLQAALGRPDAPRPVASSMTSTAAATPATARPATRPATLVAPGSPS